MAEAAICQDFGEWLSIKLEQLSIDQDVFGSYITSIVETEDSNQEEKSEALNGILSGILENSVEETSEEILRKWKQLCSASEEKQVNGDPCPTENAEDKITAIMERHAATQVSKVTRSPTDCKQKAALLARFAEVSDGEEDEFYEPEYDGGKSSNVPGGGIDDFFANTNKEDVDKHEREKREKAKMESAKKKEQDKIQREQQKQKALDRKEKEKKRTQKQERRR